MKKQLSILLGHLILLGSAAQSQTDGREWTFQGKLDKALSQLPEGTSHEHIMMPMRDGTKLATEIFLPPGKGPWPVVLMRTPYNRFSYANRVAGKGVAFVTQNSQGNGGSEKNDSYNPLYSENEILDSYDCVEWIAEQPWCNGRIGMFGGSGNGVCADMAFLSKAPHLTVVAPYVGNTYLYWGFENGVRRWLYDWLKHRGQKIEYWPKPTLATYDRETWKKILQEAGKDNPTLYIGSCGYYDICLDNALDLYQAMGDTAKIYVRTSPKAHTGIPKIFPREKNRTSVLNQWPEFFNVLHGKMPAAEPGVCYYVMGDFTDPQGPGHVIRYTREWPVPSEPISFYFQNDSTLTQSPPKKTNAHLSYAYDPRDPIPTAGGHHFYGENPSGPLDQRAINEYTNMLRLVSAPLAAPLEVVGKLSTELFISTDVPDTTFIVKLVDIYPDGYEMLVRETAFMARYANGWDSPAPLKKDQVYKLTIDMKTVAISFNKGHRIGVFVQSSSSPAYEVHPNTYEPVMSFDNSPIAHQQIHSSAKHPSRIILPATKPR